MLDTGILTFDKFVENTFNNRSKIVFYLMCNNWKDIFSDRQVKFGIGQL